ncbi:MAG TPA: bacillithiol biosynthesis deacetylase BshB1 [Thermoanaerobaculia bacterium]|nr:bacillithiol biosynthesis deacetylase BshB1 [Thermoanaerobaculia bacterium]
MTSSLDILVFGAHPDDVEIACGGTIVRALRQGQKVGIVDLTRGEMGTRGTAETRAQERSRAAEILGVQIREQLDFGDGTLRTGRKEEMTLVELIRRHRPRLLIAPWPDDRHPDHTRTGQLVTDAWFYSGLAKLESTLPAHRPDAVIYYIQNYVQQPSVVVDVSAVWPVRMEAMLAYQSQFHDPDSTEPMTFISRPSFLQLIEARARHFGGLIGVEYGEAFVSRQPPMADDLVAAYRGREIS